MKIHHICLIVSDIPETLKLYQDVLGFEPYLDTQIPSPEKGFFDQKTLDDIFHVKGAKSRIVMLRSKEGAVLELQQPSTPKVQKTPQDKLQYGNTGFHELAFAVADVDQWFESIRKAGYETQTDYTWCVGGTVKSFLFYDPDGNLVQLIEEL